MKFRIFIFLLLLSGVSVFAQTNDDEALESLVKKMTAAQATYDATALGRRNTRAFVRRRPRSEKLGINIIRF